MSKYWAVENQSSVMLRPGDRFQRMTNRSAFAYGRGLRSRACTTLKMAVLAPMPSASESTATAATARDEPNDLMADFSSDMVE